MQLSWMGLYRAPTLKRSILFGSAWLAKIANNLVVGRAFNPRPSTAELLCVPFQPAVLPRPWIQHLEEAASFRKQDRIKYGWNSNGVCVKGVSKTTKKKQVSGTYPISSYQI